MLLFLLSLVLLPSFAHSKEYSIIIKTTDKLWAGTDATVKVKLHGTNGEVEVPIRCKCEQGDRETFTKDVANVGYITGLEVYRNNGGTLPGWDLDYIIVKNAGAQDSIFNYYNEVDSGWTALTLSCSAGYAINSQGYCDVIDVDECQNPNTCISPATCTNTVGSYYCSCPSGYVLKAGTNNQCEDKNECTQYPCNSVKSTCENLPGDYRCNCKDGYENVNPKNCQNVNECTKGTDSCNKTASYCIDSDGTFWCRCKDGYTQGANNKLCEAVKCGSLVTPAGSTLEPARCTKVNANVYGDKCIMKCQAGYVISNISHGILTCSSSGQWEGNMGTCNAVTCPALPAISNGVLLPSSCTSSGGRYTYKCSFHCSSGYTLQGNQFRQCQDDGTWDGAMPTCKKVEVRPWIRCPDLITQDLLPGKSSADVSGVWKEPTSNLQPAQIAISPPEISSSYQFPAGTTMITWTVENAVGSESCSIFVIINDKEAPTVANCPSDIHEISSGPKTVTWVEPIFTDNVKVTKVEKSHTSGSTFQLGSTYISYTAQDNAKNTATCNFKVELKKPPCNDPDGPVNGIKSCSSFGGTKFCTVTCNSGSQLYKSTALYWQCNNGVWNPSDNIPDCVAAVKKDSNTACQEIQIEMNVTGFQGTTLYCAKCPTGMHKSSNTDCSPCPAGTYNEQQGKLQCTQNCPAGTSSLPGAKSSSDCKTLCSAGQFSSTGLGPNCQYCARDTYQDKVQQKSCTACPSGTSTLTIGADSLAKCGATPKVTRMEPLVANIKEGESVSVDCYASGTPTPVYFWKFLKNIPADFLGTMSQADIKDAKGAVIGSKLTITKSTYENTGSYECRATNSHGDDKGIAQINVAKDIDFGSGLDEPL